MLQACGLGSSHATRHRNVDVRLPGKEIIDCHGARPVHRIITMMKWIRTSRLSVKNSLSAIRPRSESQRSARKLIVENTWRVSIDVGSQVCCQANVAHMRQSRPDYKFNEVLVQFGGQVVWFGGSGDWGQELVAKVPTTPQNVVQEGSGGQKGLK